MDGKRLNTFNFAAASVAVWGLTRRGFHSDGARAVGGSSGRSWAILLAVILAGCGRGEEGVVAKPEVVTRKVPVQLNWYAEAEHGGVYQAEADGLYDSAGIDVEIRPGGRATSLATELQLGRVDFAITNADDMILYRAAGTDLVAVMAAMQDHPRCILVRKDSGVTSLDQLRGLTLQCQEGLPFVEILRSQGKLEGVQLVPYQGTVTGLVSDPKVAIQAYSIAEPFLAQGQGVEVLPLMISELGWNPYCSILVTRGELIRKEPEMVRAFVAATIEGWRQYLEEPAKGNQAILAANEHGMTAEALDFGVKTLRPLAVPGTITPKDLGKMEAARWKKLIEQMETLKLIEPGKVKPEECYTLEFLDPSSGPIAASGQVADEVQGFGSSREVAE